MAVSGSNITALAWESADTEKRTRTEDAANMTALDTHDHNATTTGKGVRAIQTVSTPAVAGQAQQTGEDLKWFGTSVHTAANLDQVQTVTGTKTFSQAVATILAGSQNPAAGVATTIAGSGTIASSAQCQRVTTGGNVTGIILTAGTVGGQIVGVLNTSANTITFAASGTSNVAGGVSNVINANSLAVFQWDSVGALWYALGVNLSLGYGLTGSATNPAVSLTATSTFAGSDTTMTNSATNYVGVTLGVSLTASGIYLIGGTATFFVGANTNQVTLQIQDTTNGVPVATATSLILASNDYASITIAPVKYSGFSGTPTIVLQAQSSSTTVVIKAAGAAGGNTATSITALRIG